ncbi:Gfo/Idh/MocA family oxidoreductase [Roseovarius pacificus]|uniref:Gfo/Idh/MocA family protein n=1 Tax=Roseovarius pacificus TaxID=337701 RepID=UPI002A18C23B|nr:Gfo/Idh/MocA family oxidoreductase [Roseovarius pacificus]
MREGFRWGLLGAGQVARNFGRSVTLLPGHKVAAVASRGAARAKATATELGSIRNLNSYAALAADPDIDAIYVSTPAALHREHVALALEAGKPVLCEKPFTVTADEARELAALAERHGTFCMEAMWMRFIPAIRALKERIVAGEIGEVRMLQAELGFSVPYEPESQYYDIEMGCGALLELGIYPLSLAYYVLGRPEAGQILTGNAPNGLDARATITLRFPSGTLASLSCGFDQRLRNRAIVIGTNGSFELDAPLYAPERLALTKSPQPASKALEAQQGGLLDRLSNTSAMLTRLRRRHAPLLRQLVRRERSTRSYPFLGFGYQFEAAEVARCVLAGLRESTVMPLAESVEIMECLERLRTDGCFADGNETGY